MCAYVVHPTCLKTIHHQRLEPSCLFTHTQLLHTGASQYNPLLVCKAMQWAGLWETGCPFMSAWRNYSWVVLQKPRRPNPYPSNDQEIQQWTSWTKVKKTRVAANHPGQQCQCIGIANAREEIFGLRTVIQFEAGRRESHGPDQHWSPAFAFQYVSNTKPLVVGPNEIRVSKWRFCIFPGLKHLQKNKMCFWFVTTVKLDRSFLIWTINIRELEDSNWRVVHGFLAEEFATYTNRSKLGPILPETAAHRFASSKDFCTSKGLRSGIGG